MKYNPGATTKLGTLSNGLQYPVNVTTDSSGDVFVADAGQNLVIEYLAGSSTPYRNYLGPGVGLLHGVAVDAAGDIFRYD